MASQYLAAVTNPAYAALLGLEIPEFEIRACALNCGFYIPDSHHDRMLMKCYLQELRKCIRRKWMWSRISLRSFRLPLS